MHQICVSISYFNEIRLFLPQETEDNFQIILNKVWIYERMCDGKIAGKKREIRILFKTKLFSIE